MKTIVITLKCWAVCLLIVGHRTGAVEAHVAVVQDGTNFSYRLYNDEAAGSALFLSNFHLELNAPFHVASTPTGWSFITDSFSYVDWFCTNAVAPYVNDVAPGTSLDGFVIASSVTNAENLNFAAVSWQHGNTNSGPAIQGLVRAPSIFTVDIKLANISTTGANSVEFTVHGIPPFRYAIQSSVDFTNWTSVFTNIVPFRIVETNLLLNPRRFYRATPAFDGSAIAQD